MATACSGTDGPAKACGVAGKSALVEDRIPQLPWLDGIGRDGFRNRIRMCRPRRGLTPMRYIQNLILRPWYSDFNRSIFEEKIKPVVGYTQKNLIGRADEVLQTNVRSSI